MIDAFAESRRNKALIFALKEYGDPFCKISVLLFTKRTDVFNIQEVVLVKPDNHSKEESRNTKKWHTSSLKKFQVEIYLMCFIYVWSTNIYFSASIKISNSLHLLPSPFSVLSGFVQNVEKY